MHPFTLRFPVVPTSYTLVGITEQPRGIKKGSFEMKLNWKVLSRSTPCPFSHYSRTYGASLDPVEAKHGDVHCPALSNLLCRSTSVVLRKPFQASFFLQPAHQGAPCAAQSTIYWHGFAEEAGDTVPLLWPSPGRVVNILPVTSGY